VRRAPRSGLPYLARQGVANLHRPANQTRVVVLAVGFGVFLLATLLLTQHNLLLPLRSGDVAERANLLLWDVQDDQRRPLLELLGERGHPVLQSAAIVPMRVASINGREVRPWGGGDGIDPHSAGAGEEPSGWAVRREYRSTFRDRLSASERVIRGRLWEPGTADHTQVSLERDIAGDLGVHLGDTIVWDVQGVLIPTGVTSIREVDWARFEPNFFAVFPAATLRSAPRTWVVLTRGGSAEERGLVQRAIVERFPNVAAIDLTLVQEALDAVIGRIAAVITFIGGFSVATGFVVLLGAVATGRMHRVRESVLLKALGATRRQIGGILLTEYLVLGSLSAAAGVALATGAGWALARWVFEVPFEVRPLPLAVLGVSVVALTVAIGMWASREVFRHTALEAMRGE
jgi:putative ABC transport system permease protein